MNEAIKIKVTLDRFDEVIDLADSFDLFKVTTSRAFEYLCQFVVNVKGEYVGFEAARDLFKTHRIKRGEIGAYWVEFVKKVNEAFVNPTSGETSEEQS